jgi:hypothetical protein
VVTRIVGSRSVQIANWIGRVATARIRWISYFHGGDALREFPRASFGTLQSLGCVELPEAAAAQVWPYTPDPTLVTIGS